MQPYLIPAALVTISEEIKKSRFITLLAPTSGVNEAKDFIQQVKQQHPTARHHCWAFVAGAPTDSQQLGFSDDGEPSGTAGKPILAQLMGSGIGEITAVVVRYYGGIKLGTGGLVRAYGSGVQQALKQIEVKYKVPQVEYTLQCDYAQLSIVETLLQQVDGQILQSDYAQFVTLHLSLPATQASQAGDKLRDLSRGTLQLTPIS
ncbi:YigZ family protein [Yersinia kristensenii]|uniref:Protein co-occurring with transport systems (COG1739) n=1 Tax=Yersinia kristensenii TaxID=28152 RepID=A0A0T9M0D3_YERKR|nr:IMPACT family protein [Yersinia kristensenii]OVZ82746.1 YigZ family protein [Yersinia kristensenii]PJG61407.1 YigZ family protein [Yersinia kristensenii]CFR21606.1 protein co-occurring with transport systems (COG1739) [Yersinia kristensenii]CNF04241.1 protein co-occurring with transport systems (COG1739) [Yersinia kristensenii]CNF45827.1 protein co-occurring with transport systems (COG1739) [Yersinia kristensenii]